MRSYVAEVIADSSGKFVGNALRFPPTPVGKRAAELYVRDLSWRWTLVRETRVVESDDEPSADSSTVNEWVERAEAELEGGDA